MTQFIPCKKYGEVHPVDIIYLKQTLFLSSIVKPEGHLPIKQAD